MLAVTKEQLKRAAPADTEGAAEGPALKRERVGGAPSLAELLRSKGRGVQSNSDSEEDNAPLAHSRKPTSRQSKGTSKVAAVKNTVKETSTQAETVFELSARRRVAVRKWMGKVLVDVREFYDDHGTAKPGKKGISLSLEQWGALAGRLGGISDAVNIVEEDRVGDKGAVAKMGACLVGTDAGDKRSIAFTLSPKRRVTVRYFRNAVLIDIREYYDQGGIAKPGKKGISLSKAQWDTLRELASAISAAAKKL